ncbi:hypothetical protein LOY97_001988 [Ophidiomyces ophidiicola]|nr:hypothetical protein LOZ49_001715 [Ophidiomyces ophidiicola]KAI2132902.1 hypothetical protein LOZ29_004953 [Ophidiomyces ophidiicola]KAI2134488.1 hypothetical protein LOZ28_004938 [Ophidiomyces ophidiicola]KAI2214197.1 hypothetical protein LOZ15_004856 [Ophidiomyces ophidiicola]KAI2344160.1 hypothetical protein LOY92_006010 [Ophidiomyces ophidiicola]
MSAMDMCEVSTVEDQVALSKVALTFQPTDRVLPEEQDLESCRQSLRASLPLKGLGFADTKEHILKDIVPGLNLGSVSPNYYGFVTGGVTPAAWFADNVVSAYDQNVQVHIREHSTATDVEDRALGLLMELFHLERKDWSHATITSGATASNILGLACGREYVFRAAAQKSGVDCKSVGEYGIAEVLRATNMNGLQVLSTLPHSSMGKAAGILGIGRSSVKNVSLDGNPLQFDLDRLEKELSLPGVASIVTVSCGEVNTGRFATGGIEEFKRIRDLCDRYNAWLHADGAFGIFGRMFFGQYQSTEFDSIRRGCEGLELADSITADGHKLLNVPYDCGFFFSRHSDIAQDVFRNPNAAYLASSNVATDPVVSPNNIGIENSRRFRALPVYATLLAYGQEGYRSMLERQIKLARRVAAWLFDHPKYITLPNGLSREKVIEDTFIIVLFSARDDDLNTKLMGNINRASKIYVSGTSWEGRAACRIAVSTYKVDVERDFARIVEVLEDVAN